MAKEFLFKGHNLEQMQNMSLEEFLPLVPSRERRSLTRGFTEQQKILLKNIKESKKPVKTHCRDLVIIPEMLGKAILVHSGKSFDRVDITIELLGHRLGEYALTRKKVGHSAPGIGATRSSAALSVR